jgi:tetratricopeptide (TPR) repeat protein
VKLNPREPNLHDSLGLIYQRTGQYAEAVESYQRALSLKPDFELAVIHLGNTYFQLGRYREAIGQYRRYVEIVPLPADRARGVESLGWVYWKKHDLPQAAKELSSWADKHYNLRLDRLVAFEQGKLPATAELRAYVSGDEGVANRTSRLSDRPSQYFLGRLELKTGRAEEAVRVFRQALRELPTYWTLDDMEDCLGEAYLELGRLDEAMGEYRRVLKMNPNRALARYHLGVALDRKGENAAARGEFQCFLEIWKNADEDVPERIDAARRVR